MTYFVELFKILLLLIILFTVSKKAQQITKKVLGESKENLDVWINTVINKYAPNALIIINTHGHVISWNRGAEIMFERTFIEMYNQSLLTIIPEEYHKEHIEWLKTYRETETTIIGSILYRPALRKNGEIFQAKLSFYQDKTIPDFDVFVIVVQDLTEIQELKDQTRREIMHMEKYESIAKLGGWCWNLSTDIVSRTKGFNRIFETDEDEEMYSDLFMKRVHIEDRKAVNDIIINAFEKEESYETFYRIKKQNEEIIKIYVKAEPEFDKNGKLAYYVGIIQQIK